MVTCRPVWAGVKQRDPLLRSHIIPLGALVGVVTELGAVVARLQLSLQTDLVPSSFPSLLLLRRQLLFLALPA